MKMNGIWLQTGLGVVLVAGLVGCHGNSVSAQSGPDPAAANLAQPAAENEAQQQAAQYNGQQAAPIERDYPDAAPQPGYADSGQQAYSSDPNDADAPVDYDSLTDEQATEPPPPLPDYDQPPAPDPDYLWTPGYWAWGPEGYYWVPGCWVEAPYVGALWTPGYWGYVGNVYRFHHGYWGRHVGFYGGINYGFGYIGFGYEGGYWNGSHFFYNTAVTRVNVNVVRNVYVHNVTVDRGPRVSFDGGRGGLQVRPRPAELAAIHEQRYAPMQAQVQVRQQASQNRQQFYSANHGRPAETVAARPVVSDHRMPAEMPRAAGVTRPAAGVPAQVNPSNRPAETARPGQPQNGARPQTQQRPEQQARPQQPQQQQSQGGRPEFDNRGQSQRAPEQFHGQPAPEQFHGQPQPMRQAAPPQVQHTAPQQPAHTMPENRPAPQIRQGPPVQVAQPQPMRQAPPPHTAPQMHAPPAAHAQPHPAPQHGNGGEEHHP